MARIIIALVLMTISFAPAGASDVTGSYAVFSVGGKPCLSYTQSRQNPSAEQHQFIEWLQGYLSAFNVLAPGNYNVLGDKPFSAALIWLDQYCQSHPQQLFIDASNALSSELFPTRANLAP